MERLDNRPRIHPHRSRRKPKRRRIPHDGLHANRRKHHPSPRRTRPPPHRRPSHLPPPTILNQLTPPKSPNPQIPKSLNPQTPNQIRPKGRFFKGAPTRILIRVGSLVVRDDPIPTGCPDSPSSAQSGLRNTKNIGCHGLTVFGKQYLPPPPGFRGRCRAGGRVAWRCRLRLLHDLRIGRHAGHRVPRLAVFGAVGSSQYKKTSGATA